MTIVTGYVRDRNGDLLADAKVHLIQRDTGGLLGSAVSGDGSEAQEGDADYDHVSILLHGNGENNSTTIIDSGPANRTCVANGSAKISTGWSKFSGSSILCPSGNNGSSNITVNGTFANLGSNDFEIAFFCYVLAWDTYSFILSNGSGSANRGWAVDLTSTRARFYYTANGSTDITLSFTYSFSLNTEYFIRFRRSGTTLYCYVNDTLVGQNTIGTIYNSSGPFRVGVFMDYVNISHCYQGYVDEIRITIGAARSETTAPTSEFLDLVLFPAKPLGLYSIDTTYSGEVQRIVCAPDAWDPIANDLIDRIILP